MGSENALTKSGWLRVYHERSGARFTVVNGVEAVAEYGEPAEEYAALRETAGVLDLSFRGRICLAGADRARFLHGQVTNNIKALQVGEGCYAALITAKGKMQSDLNVYCLQDELLLDFEPGLTDRVVGRLEKYIIADDVQVVDVASLYGLISIQGPKASLVVQTLLPEPEVPAKPFNFVKVSESSGGEIYLVNQPRVGTSGFDLYFPLAGGPVLMDRLIAAAKTAGGRLCGWLALESTRIEAGIPRFGADMDESNIPLEAGIEGRAVSFTKGCYIGQEVISRIRTYGQVAKALRGLVLSTELKALPLKGDKLACGGKDVGYITSAVHSPALETNLALGYVRKEVNHVGTRLTVRTSEGEFGAQVVELPFRLSRGG